jgi:hypothetical protein
MSEIAGLALGSKLRCLVIALLLAALSSTVWAQHPNTPQEGNRPKQEQAQPLESTQSTAAKQQSSPQPPTAVNVLPPQKTESELAAEKNEREEKARLDRGLVYATDALVIATILLVVVTAGLVVFARRQSQETKILQRAYIAVVPGGIRPYRRRRANARVGSSEDLTGHFTIENVGHLPAREVSWSVQIVCDERRERADFSVEENGFVGNMAVPPGMKMPRATKVIWSTDFKLFNNEKAKYCYVWGQVRYKDGFDNPRITNFCHRYNCEALTDQNSIPPDHARYHEHGDWNDAT